MRSDHALHVTQLIVTAVNSKTHVTNGCSHSSGPEVNINSHWLHDVRVVQLNAWARRHAWGQCVHRAGYRRADRQWIMIILTTKTMKMKYVRLSCACEMGVCVRMDWRYLHCVICAMCVLTSRHDSKDGIIIDITVLTATPMFCIELQQTRSNKNNKERLSAFD